MTIQPATLREIRRHIARRLRDCNGKLVSEYNGIVGELQMLVGMVGGVGVRIKEVRASSQRAPRFEIEVNE